MGILTEFKNLLIESLTENKKLIIGLYIIFIVCFILAWILLGPRVENTVNKVSAINTGATGTSVSVISLFINNEWGGIVTYVGSIFFAIPAFVMLIYNALNLGALGSLFNIAMPNGGLRYIIYLIPHGIFEITATVIQSVAGILFFLFIWRFIKALRSSETHGASDAFEKSKKPFVQSLILMIFATILLIIAAPIEAYVSVPFSNFILGF